ncbi:MAG: isoleucine--tRNA ligase [Gammaproteobacteria bacterium TMED78]|nr:MAG: isoleucine--tRNA ligase [Gammaproteobacteria bacterium TMED78]|tara:strand:+ start:10384 stop:13170 length:2787 start_codon:yes stop_codon:yes gene_type:complete
MTDYKDTLNLPKAKLAMKANLPSNEPKILDYWEKIDLYKKIKESRSGRKTFILHDGPPYANGKIHMGHAVNKVLKDMVIKSQTLFGRYAPYVPGWDCHGLPIELNVEKKIGKAGQKISVSKFREACREYASSQIEIQKKDFKRLGVQGDWSNSYVTMDYKFEANIVRALGKIIKEGHLHRGYKPVHWCVDCKSALAEAEVEYQDKISSSIDFLFPIDDSRIEKIFSSRLSSKVYVASWTTTPWTLPGNLALTINHDFIYQLVSIDKKGCKAIIIAEDLVEPTMKRIDCEDYKILGSTKGSNLLGLKAKHPYLSRDSVILSGDHVTTDAGTGIVHTAPGHGLEDYSVAMENNLDVLNPVKGNGTFSEEVEFLAGMFVFKSNEKVIEILDDNGVLLSKTDYEHSYPHCWRHKTPLMFRATPQWFISMENKGLLKKASLSINKIHWEPDWGQARIASMLQGRPDWCISRQRTWGVPITILVHSETGEIHPENEKVIDKIATLIEKKGIQAWYDEEISELIEDAENYEKITDCLDVWFDSGVTHSCVLDNEEELSFPADLYLEGSDQHRGWFQSSLLTSIAINGTAPYKAVLTHGFVVDSEGKKMSKSIGNTISPQKVWDSLGADVLRVWIASIDYSKEIVLSDDVLKRASDSYRRIRNTIRFLLGNISDFDSEDSINKVDLTELDKWMIYKCKNLQINIKKDYENFHFHQAFQKIHNFCANDLGGFYLDILKDRLYTSKRDSNARRSSQTALSNILQALLRWISPILSFTAEEAYLLLEDSSDSVHLLEWFEKWHDYGDLEISDNEWNEILEIRSEVNKHIENARNDEIIGSSLDASLELYCNDSLKRLLDKFSEELRFIFITSEVRVISSDKGRETAIPGLRVRVTKCDYEKCVRCWHRRPDVGQVSQHELLCERCYQNVEGQGEVRLYV